MQNKKRCCAVLILILFFFFTFHNESNTVDRWIAFKNLAPRLPTMQLSRHSLSCGFIVPCFTLLLVDTLHFV